MFLLRSFTFDLYASIAGRFNSLKLILNSKRCNGKASRVNMSNLQIKTKIKNDSQNDI